MFVVGDFHSAQLEDLKPGTQCTVWDYLAEWDDDCLPASKVGEWRKYGDDLCDRVVEELDIKAGVDGLERLQNYVQGKPRSEWALCIQEFWDQVSVFPPDLINAALPYTSTGRVNAEADPIEVKEINENGLEATPDRLINYSDTLALSPSLALGQAVFWKYSAEIFSSLSHFSLAAGFASPRIMAVLNETNYLTSSNRNATYRRLLETTQFVLDAMNGMTPITGQGWKSAIRVRFLHSTVRLRILKNKGLIKEYDQNVHGVPLNQEDLAVTLGSFSVAPLWSLRRMGINLTDTEQAAYLAAWRHIGYYLGIDQGFLRRYYGKNNSCAQKIFTCLAITHFLEMPVPSNPTSTASYRILSAISNRPPSSKSIEYHCEFSRLLLGNEFADQLAIPRSRSWKTRWNLWVTVTMSRFFFTFGKFWRTGWEIKRRELFRTLFPKFVAWKLDESRTKFLPKSEKGYENNEREAEDKEPLKFELGPKQSRELRKHWKFLIGEAGLVTGSFAIIAGFIVSSFYSSIHSWQIL